MRPRRLVILGVAGTGKTSLALRLSRRLELPVFHLDSVADANGPADPTQLHARMGEQPTTVLVPRPLGERLDIVAGIAAGDRWIAEGAFIDWTGELRTRADAIIWLDHVSMARAFASVLGRTLRSRGRQVDHGAEIGPGGAPSRVQAYWQHGIELLLELWDVAGYFWRSEAPGVEQDIAAGRWDRLSRAQVRRELAIDADRLLHVRQPAELDGLEDRIVRLAPASERSQPADLA